MVWNLSGDEPKEEKVIEGVIPAVSDTEYADRSNGRYCYTN